MRILLIGNYAPDRQESMLRFGELMVRELNVRGHQATLIQPRRFASKLTSSASGGTGKWLGYLDKFVLFPFVLKRMLANFDVVHICDHSNSIYTRYLRGIPHVVTCHDVLAIKSAQGEVPENATSATGKKLQGMILAGLQAAQYIVCVSSISREDMLRVTGRPPKTSTVVYNSLSYPYSPMPREQALERLGRLGYDGAAPFFLHVGGDAWYKNRSGLLHIFHHLQTLLAPAEPRLLLVGPPLEKELADFVRQRHMDAHVTQLAGLSNEDLRAVYSLAEGLIFPSIQEGFGWPVLEAQACGCPVFATRREPMTEIGGDAAIYFDPADPAAAAAIIARSLAARDAICAKGFENLRRFSVDQLIEGYLHAYRHIL